MSDNADNSLFGNVKGSLSLVQNFYIEFFGTLTQVSVKLAEMIIENLADDPSKQMFE